MPTLSNEPVNNQWLSDILYEVYNEGIHNVDGKRGMNFTLNQAKLAILSKLESIEQEAYKKGYIQKGIDDLTRKG
jgi:hypothetical protein